MEYKIEKTTSLAQLHEFNFKDLHRIRAGIPYFFFSSILVGSRQPFHTFLFKIWLSKFFIFYKLNFNVFCFELIKNNVKNTHSFFLYDILYTQIICCSLIHDRLIWFLFCNQAVLFHFILKKSRRIQTQLIALNHSSKEIFERSIQ